MASIYWSGSPNGNIPHAKLAAVPNFFKLSADSPASIEEGSNLLMPEAARQVSGLMQAFYKQFKRKLNLREGYRPLDIQVYWKAYYTGLGLPRNAATPGTSNHGWALSCDFGVDEDNRDFNAEELAWMRANAPKYGFLNDVSWEPWHWTYLATPSTIIPQLIANPQTGAVKPPTPVTYLKGFNMQNVSAEKSWFLYLADGSSYKYRDMTVSGQKFTGSAQRILVGRLITAQRNGTDLELNDLEHEVLQAVFAKTGK